MCDDLTVTFILLASQTEDSFKLFIGPEKPQWGVANYVHNHVIFQSQQVITKVQSPVPILTFSHSSFFSSLISSGNIVDCLSLKYSLLSSLKVE